MKGKLLNVSEEDNYYFRYKPDALHCKSSRSRSLSLQKKSLIMKRRSLHCWTLGRMLCYGMKELTGIVFIRVCWHLGTWILEWLPKFALDHIVVPVFEPDIY